jgi:L-threonylcarbamoyladenylate synthase
MKELKKITDLLHQGKLIAYPTEGVFGLGCDPLNESAVKDLLCLKQRPIEKGLIVIAANWQQLEKWIGDLPKARREIIQQSSLEPITWVVPASPYVPAWIRGAHESVAVRVVQHSVAAEICAGFGGPIVSTSANKSDELPCKTYQETVERFSTTVAYIVNAPVGDANKPSKICNALSGKVLRA